MYATFEIIQEQICHWQLLTLCLRKISSLSQRIFKKWLIFKMDARHG